MVTSRPPAHDDRGMAVARASGVPGSIVSRREQLAAACEALPVQVRARFVRAQRLAAARDWLGSRTVVAAVWALVILLCFASYALPGGTGMRAEWGVLTAIGVGFVLLVVVRYPLRRVLARASAEAWRDVPRICRACGYLLERLPVEADGCVVCPECGCAWRAASAEAGAGSPSASG